MTGPYTFNRLAAADLPLVHDWLRRPHVAEWWDDDGEIAAIVADRKGDTVPYLVRLAGRPLGYLQCSELEPAVRGIDQFIGEPDLVGRGHGSAFIRLFCDRLFDADLADAVTTDPDPRNARAVRAYVKAGFRPVAGLAPPSQGVTSVVLSVAKDLAGRSDAGGNHRVSCEREILRYAQDDRKTMTSADGGGKALASVLLSGNVLLMRRERATP